MGLAVIRSAFALRRSNSRRGLDGCSGSGYPARFGHSWLAACSSAHARWGGVPAHAGLGAGGRVADRRGSECGHGPADADLAEISRHVAADAHAILTIDGAGWHKLGGELRVPENITLLHLPPYSPELNPVENIWAYLRGNKLSNRIDDSYTAIVKACCDAWTWLLAQPERITSIASRDWTYVTP